MQTEDLVVVVVPSMKAVVAVVTTVEKRQTLINTTNYPHYGVVP